MKFRYIFMPIFDTYILDMYVSETFVLLHFMSYHYDKFDKYTQKMLIKF